MTALTTPTEVMDLTGVSVAATDIARAQFLVGTFLGMDLGADFDYLTTTDQAILTNAVVWQCVFDNAHPEIAQRDPSVSSASTNGVAVSFVAPTDGIEAFLGPIAVRALAGLSWRRQAVRIDTVRMRRSDDYFRPDPWRTIRSGGHL